MKSYWVEQEDCHECAGYHRQEYVLKSEAIAYAEERVKAAMNDRFSGAQMLAEVEKALSREREAIIEMLKGLLAMEGNDIPAVVDIKWLIHHLRSHGEAKTAPHRCDKCGVTLGYGQSAEAIAEKAVSRERKEIIEELRIRADKYKPAGQYDHESHIVENCISLIRSRDKQEPVEKDYMCTCRFEEVPDCPYHSKLKPPKQEPSIWKTATSSDSAVMHLVCCCPRCKAKPPKIERFERYEPRGLSPIRDKINELVDAVESLKGRVNEGRGK
jgi:hypothetical protein